MRSNLVVPVVEVERTRRARPARRRSLLRSTLSRLLLIVICASVAFPFFWIAVNSLQPLSLVLATPPRFWPAQPQWHNYADAWHAEPFGQFYVNSIVVSTAIVVGQVITCALAAYAVSWINSYQALIVPFLASAFGIFLLRQSFLRVPRALVEAARIDGASHLWVLLRVVAPLSLPGFITLFVIFFVAQRYLVNGIVSSGLK